MVEFHPARQGETLFRNPSIDFGDLSQSPLMRVSLQNRGQRNFALGIKETLHWLQREIQYR